MKGLKKFLSLILVVSVVFSAAPNVSALGGNVRVLVAGTKSAKEKFFSVYGGDEKFDHRKDQDDFDGAGYQVVIAAVDADQDPEQVEGDIRYAVDHICDSKSSHTQVIVVGCTDRCDVQANDPYFNRLAGCVTAIERECTEGDGWGSDPDHKRRFAGSKQFLCFCKSTPENAQELMNLVIDRAKVIPLFSRERFESCAGGHGYKIIVAAAVVVVIVVFAIYYMKTGHVSPIYPSSWSNKTPWIDQTNLSNQTDLSDPTNWSNQTLWIDQTNLSDQTN